MLYCTMQVVKDTLHTCLKTYLDSKKPGGPAVLQDLECPEDQDAQGHNPFQPADGMAPDQALVGDEELSAEVDRVLSDMEVQLSVESSEVCGLLAWLA